LEISKDKGTFKNYCCEENGKYSPSDKLCKQTIDEQNELNETFCSVDKLWDGESRIVTAYQLNNKIKLLVHPALIPFLNNLKKDLEKTHYALRPDEVVAFNPRSIRNSPKDTEVNSKHAYGLAIDINWNTNPHCPLFPSIDKCAKCESALVSDIPKKVIELFEKAGFEWGGNWNIPDPMHFELRKDKWPNSKCSDWEKFRVLRSKKN